MRIIAVLLVLSPITLLGYDWQAPCDTIQHSTVDELLQTQASTIRELTEDEYFNAECHINDDTYTYVNEVKKYVLSVMRYGDENQSKEAKKILKEMAKLERKILPRVFGGVPISEKKEMDLRNRIEKINEQIEEEDFQYGSARYLESDRFWSWFKGK